MKTATPVDALLAVHLQVAELRAECDALDAEIDRTRQHLAHVRHELARRDELGTTIGTLSQLTDQIVTDYTTTLAPEALAPAPVAPPGEWLVPVGPTDVAPFHTDPDHDGLDAAAPGPADVALEPYDPAAARRSWPTIAAFAAAAAFVTGSTTNRFQRWLTRGLSVLVMGVFLASFGPKFLPYQMFYVRTGSMEPTIPVGSLIVLRPVKATNLRIGDVISFHRPDNPSEIVTHRIHRIVDDPDEGLVFRTKGDANTSEDSWSIPARGKGWRYSFKVPLLGYLAQGVGSRAAQIGLIALPATALAGLALSDVWRPGRREPAA
ncbi:MAG: signal peptidase [Actinomycetia bacterium]|nr:signal peptidase [Actinomycetes bacterium]